jgi:ABC-type amino acid transport substrate-binding protein
MLRGLYIASAAGLLIAGAAAGLNYAFLRPTTLRVAVSQGTDDHRLVEAIARVFSGRDGVRLRVVPVSTANASSAALQSENVDLAVIRSDISIPPNGQTLVILHRNPALLVGRGDDTIGSVPDLKGKTVGIVRGTATGMGNVKLFDTILAQYEIDPGAVRHEVIERDAMAEAVKSRQVDAIFVVGPATADFPSEAVTAMTKAAGSAKFERAGIDRNRARRIRRRSAASVRSLRNGRRVRATDGARLVEGFHGRRGHPAAVFRTALDRQAGKARQSDRGARNRQGRGLAGSSGRGGLSRRRGKELLR